MKTKIKNIQNERGITLIALVVTIIVLLLLAGISISMLTGQNGILNRAGEAKEATSLAQAQEAVGMVCSELMINTYAGNSETNIKKVAEELKRKGYQVESKYPAGVELVRAKLTEGSTISVEKGKTATANIELITSSGESKNYYMIVNGENYEIIKDASGNIKLANTPTRISGLLEDDAIEITSIDTTYATATINGKEITLTGVAKGTTTLKVTVNGTEYTVGNIDVKELKKLSGINMTSMILDGASLITAGLQDNTIATSDDVIWTSSDKEVATVTSNGIVKCGSKTGTAEIRCKGTGNAAPKKCIVTNTASKIVYTNNGTANATINGSLEDKAYNQPTIPVGFSAIDTQDAKWVTTGGVQTDVNKGLVIMDEKGNQFVWIPISADVYDADNDGEYYEKWCTTNQSYEDCTDDTLSDGTALIDVDTSKTYGGFWIGRYEAGLDVDLGSTVQTSTLVIDRNINSTIRPIIVEGASPWNCIDYTNSQKNAERIVNNSYVRSGLVNGTQWDTALAWIKKNTALEVGDTNASTAWGNCKLSNITTLDRFAMYFTDSNWIRGTSKPANSSYLLRTGASTQTKSLNISDLAGNVHEWTNEICLMSNRVSRGGDFYDDKESLARATYRWDTDAGAVGGAGGFRCVLYIK